MIDTEDRIARSNIYCIFGTLLRGCIYEDNNKGEVLLKKSGLSSFVDEYKSNLCPYVYYKGYKNDNEEYNPEYVCISICEKIESDDAAILLFFNNILELTFEIEDKLCEKLSNYLNVIGYELCISNDKKREFKNYKLVQDSKGARERNYDMSFLENKLKEDSDGLYAIYNEAISNFGAARFLSCIDSSRILFERFFEKMDPERKSYIKGILFATGESIIKNGKKTTSIKDIYEYWLDNKEGANRFRLFHTMYSAMSGLGAHKEDDVSKEDALLLLRYVEDCLLWCYRKGIC
ncbi:MAG: hypothetical protein HFE63_04730 [Clostridiales bacterium]|nr:hypothetical protein [Clostridiales bacterium]